MHARSKMKKFVGCNKNVGAFARNPMRMRKCKEI
jgi:hypothetical protein